MQVQGVTVSVSDLARSRAFYEGVLGFVPDDYYAPTRWQPYKFDGRTYFAIIEVPGFQRNAGSDVVNFDVDEIKALWDRVRDKVEVEAALCETPWDSYRFIIVDPDGCRLVSWKKSEATRSRYVCAAVPGRTQRPDTPISLVRNDWQKARMRICRQSSCDARLGLQRTTLVVDSRR